MARGLDGIDVVVLAGGLGTRLRSVLGEETPKILAPVHGRPFLDLLIDWMAAIGGGRLILSLGFRAEKVITHLGKLTPALPVEIVVESTPLGTAGALRLASPRTTSDPVMVINGDTWLDADLGAALTAHRQAGRPASLVCVEVPNGSRYGRVELAVDGSVSRFAEKEHTGDSGPALINAGVFLLSHQALARLSASQGTSLERDFLAKLPAGWLGAHVCTGAQFIDIGTPDSFARADSVIAIQGKEGE